MICIDSVLFLNVVLGVPLDTLIRFNKLKALTTDYSVICAAVSNAPSQLLAASDDGLKIGRSPNKPLPVYNEEWRETLKHRSVYVVCVIIHHVPFLSPIAGDWGNKGLGRVHPSVRLCGCLLFPLYTVYILYQCFITVQLHSSISDEFDRDSIPTSAASVIRSR